LGKGKNKIIFTRKMGNDLRYKHEMKHVKSGMKNEEMGMGK